MDTSTLSASDWPPKDENGNTIHYKPNVSSPPMQRGILLASSRGLPTVQWWKLLDTFYGTGVDVLNVVLFKVPNKVEKSKRQKVVETLRIAFALAFPDKVPARIYFVSGTGIVFKTPCSNVRASEIIATACSQKWTAGGQPLEALGYVGLETSELLQPIRFEDVPQTRKEEFISTLPQFLVKGLGHSREVEVVDIWEQQSRTSQDAEWKFDNQIWVLLCTKPLPNDEDLDFKEIVSQWPGWYHFEDDYLIKINYNGRFDFCKSCKHSAQDMEGANRRHLSHECIRIMCGKCGHAGHDSSAEDSSEAHKKVCEEGRKRRREEKEQSERASKRQKSSQDAAEESEAQSKAVQAAVESIGTQIEDAEEPSVAAGQTARNGDDQEDGTAGKN